MVIRVFREQLDKLSQTENEQYLNKLHSIIVKHSPSLEKDPGLMQCLKDADSFVKRHGFNDKSVITDFLIESAYNPYFYQIKSMNRWLLAGTESVEREYIKYQQIKKNLISRGWMDNNT